MICAMLQNNFWARTGVKEWWTPGKVGSVGKVKFNKGQEFTHGSKQFCGTRWIDQRRRCCYPSVCHWQQKHVFLSRVRGWVLMEAGNVAEDGRSCCHYLQAPKYYVL